MKRIEKSGAIERADLVGWLEQGNTVCVFCLQPFDAEDGARCSDCDRLVCATCAVWTARPHEMRCPQCAGDGGEG